MGNFSKRILSSLVTGVLLISIIGTCGACFRTNKKEEAQKKSCEGVVEDYLVFLRSGKLDRLKRYADPDGDPFQDISLQTTAQEDLWNAFIGKLEFEFGETEISDDEATVSVTVSLPDAAKALKSEGSSLTYISAVKLISDTRKTVESEIEIPLEIGEDDDDTLITSTEELYDLVMEQYNIITEALPVGDVDKMTKLDQYMKKLLAIDIYYLYAHSHFTELDRYSDSYRKFYSAINSLITYELEYVSNDDDNTAHFVVHAHMKDYEQVASDFFTNPEKLAPMLYRIIENFVRNDLKDDVYDELDFDALVTYFHDDLEASPTIDRDFQVTVEVDNPRDADSFHVSGDLGSLILLFDPWDYIDELTEEDSLVIYKMAGQQLYDDGKITDLDLRQVFRSIEGHTFDEAKVDEVLTKYGFAKNSGSSGDSLIYYDATGDFRIIIDPDLELMEPVFENSNLLVELNEMIEDGEMAGAVTGNCFDFSFQGMQIVQDYDPNSDDAPEHKVYTRCISTTDAIYKISIFDYSDDQMEIIHSIIDELDLEV